MNDNDHISPEVMEKLQYYAREGIQNAARGFSSMLGQQLNVSNPVFEKVSVTEISRIVGGPETEAIGIYLRAEGNVGVQIMLIIPYDKSLELVDLLMDVPAGTSTQLGRMERSALAEVGNLTTSFFLNSLSTMTGISIRPTPPAVMVDMVGAILDIVIATSGDIGDHVLLLQADFMNGDRSVETSFWVIPDTATLEALASKG